MVVPRFTTRGLGRDTFTRNVTDGWTDNGPTLVRKLIYRFFFLKNKAGIMKEKNIMHIYLEACNILKRKSLVSTDTLCNYFVRQS